MEHREPMKPRLYLARPNRTIVGEIHHFYGLTRDTSLGNPSVIDFQVPYRITKFNKPIDNPIAPLLKNRYAIKFVDRDYEEWFMIKTPVDNMEDDADFKTISAYSQEIELQDRRISHYSATSKTASQILQDALAETVWSIGTVEAGFDLLYRSMEASDVSVLDFVYEIALTFNALALFDTTSRKISFRVFENYGIEDGFEASYGSLLKNARKVDSDEEFFTRFVGVGENGLGIQEKNPTGQAFVEDYSYFMYPFERDELGNVLGHSDYMSDELCHALLDYRALIQASAGDFETLYADKATIQATLRSQQNVRKQLNDELIVIETQLSTANAFQLTVSSAALVLQKEAKQAEIAAQDALIAATQQQIGAVEEDIETLREQLSIESNFAPELVVEWQNYIIEGRFEDANITDVSQLMEATLEEFAKVKQPKLLIELGIVNFYQCVTEADRRLRLGDIIKIKNTQVGIDVKAKLIGLKFDYESDDISLTISNVQELLTDRARALRELYKTSSTSATVTSNLYKWNAAATDVNEVQSVLNGVWDAAEREIVASSNESVEISRKGIITRDLLDPDKYVVMQHGQIALTDDGGNSWKSVLTAQGLYAPRLYGQIIAGVDLLITNSGGTFSVGPSGVAIAGTSLSITGGGLRESEINGTSTAKWNAAEANAKLYTDSQIGSVNAILTDLSSDDKLTGFEKQQAKQQWEAIVLEKPVIEAEADSFGLTAEKTAYATAYSALSAYLAPLLANLSTTSAIAGDEFRQMFNAYFDKRALLLKAASVKAKQLADAAQTSANSALGLLADMANDGKLTALEKQQTKLALDAIDGEKPLLEEQADAYYVTTEKTDLNNAYNALKSYLTPLLANLTATSDIDGAVFRATFKAYYDAKTALQNVLVVKAEAAAKAYTDGQVNSLNVLLAELASDSKLTPNEKQQTKREWDIIVGEKPIIESQATTFAIGAEKTAFVNAFNALDTYVGPLLADLASTSTIVGSTFRSVFASYTNSRTTLLKVISEKAKTLADTAQSAANTANGLLADLSDDGKLVPSEKQQVKLEWDTIVSERTVLEAQATAYGVTTQKTVYTNAYNALDAYITPLLASLSSTSDITGAAFRSTFKAYYDARTALQNEITNKAAQTAKDYADGQLASKIDELSADNLLTGFEKQEVKRQWDIVVAEKPTLDDQADVYAITAEKAALSTAYTTLNNYLSPLLGNLTVASTIVGATLRTNFSNYYDKRALLLKAISDKAVQATKSYNGVVIDTSGLTITTTDTKSRSLFNASTGLTLQANMGTAASPIWVDRLKADSQGNLVMMGAFKSGMDASAVRADTNGLYIGSSSFNDAPVRISPSGNATFAGTLTASNVVLTGGRMGWGKFGFDENGRLNASEATITGDITANAIVANATIDSPIINGGKIKSDSIIEVETDVTIGRRLLFSGTGDKSIVFTGSGNINFLNNSGMQIEAYSFVEINTTNVNFQVTGAVEVNGAELATREWVEAQNYSVAKWA